MTFLRSKEKPVLKQKKSALQGWALALPNVSPEGSSSFVILLYLGFGSYYKDYRQKNQQVHKAAGTFVLVALVAYSSYDWSWIGATVTTGVGGDLGNMPIPTSITTH